jgi:hypothetical protein
MHRSSKNRSATHTSPSQNLKNNFQFKKIINYLLKLIFTCLVGKRTLLLWRRILALLL